MSYDPFDAFVLQEMPDFIAINYQRALHAQSPRERVQQYLHVYTLGLRALAIVLVSQYLLHDRREVRDANLNDLLWNEFPHLTIDTWQRIFFAALQAYRDKREMFFIPELYDLYWNSDHLPHTMRADVKRPFSRLTQIGVELTDRNREPQDEEGWMAYARETQDLVEQVLHSLTFLSKYSLIRVLGQNDTSYSYEMHRGLDVVHGNAQLPTASRPMDDRFYLRSDDGELLELHPLFVFWSLASVYNPATSTEVGIFDRLLEAQLQYVLARSGGTALDSDRVTAFISYLFDTVERVKLFRQEAEQLTWRQLHDICADITKMHTASVSEKFRRDLYVQRSAAHQELENFLTSDKRCFVLVGRSGVGKSNFLLALQDELASTRDDICVLLYDGSQLPINTTLESVVAQDFDQRISIAGKRITDIWREIASIDDMSKRQVVLCVDAVNENNQATNLLRQLNQLAQQPWPWLKVVFSSRPETWQAIRHGVPLAEALYYQPHGQQRDDAIGVTLESFSFSQRLDEFSRGEFAEAYTKYQRKFQVQTSYDDLSFDQKQILRDPLNLYIVARTYRQNRIPSSLRASALVDHYIEALLETGTERLEPDDLRFLEKRLLPLMIREGHYSNVLTANDLHAGGDGLYEAVYSSQSMSDGHVRNQSFVRLTDADILINQRSGRNPRVAFKYERFYEYFAGQRLLSLSAAHPSRSEYFGSLALRTSAQPYLWGAVRNAIVADASLHGSGTLIDLCHADQQRTKELMVDSLISFGADQPEHIGVTLRELLPLSKQRSTFQRIRQLALKPPESSGVGVRAGRRAAVNARKIAIEVASILELPDVLRDAARDVDPTVRTTAVRYAYQLWRRNQERGFVLLDRIAEDATPGLIPDAVALESFVGFSLIIFFDHLHDTEALKRLQRIWHNAIGRLLGIDQSANRLSAWLRDAIRQRVYAIAVSLAFRLLHDFGEFNPMSVARVDAFFQLSQEQKQLYRRLVDYLDVDGRFSEADVESDYLAALQIRNIVVEAVAELGLSARLTRNPNGYLPFIKRLFAEVESNPVPNAWRNNLTYCLAWALDKHPEIDEVFDFFMYAMEKCQAYYSEGDNRKASSTTDAPDAEFLGHYIVAQYARAGTVQTPWLMQKMESARERKSLEFFKSLIESHLPQVGIEKRQPEAALNTLALVLRYEDEEITKMTSAFLAHLRIYYPDDVDAFLEDEETPEAFRLLVRTSEPAETVGELIGFRIYDFLLNDVVLSSSDLRTQFISILATAAERASLREWMDYLIPEVVNRIYGGPALRGAK
ncbi:MAG TPA: hypothetical protein VF808_12000 [Ktedonobacterales bacterium]